MTFVMMYIGGNFMFVHDQYKLYQMAHTFINEHNYRMLQVDYEKDVLWLEKYKHNVSHVIRLSLTGFDWKNHLKQDMLHSLQQIDVNQRLITGKVVEFYNIYVSSHAPVDHWTNLQQPISVNRRKKTTMYMFYFDRENFFDEYHRFYELTGIEMDWIYDIPSESYAEQFILAYKNKLRYLKRAEKERAREIFSYGKPRLTYLLIALNVVIFFIVELTGGSMDIEHLIDFGAKYNPYIVDGQWWRIISSMFLHIGFFHIFMNMLALYYLGHAVERIFGTLRFLIIYMLAGIGGGLASFAFTIQVSAGASGAIFGVFGALFFFGAMHKQLFLQTMGRNLLIIIGINIVFGFVVPQIDNSAHLGGLISGFIGATIVFLPNNKQMVKQWLATILYVVIAVFLALYGINTHQEGSLYQLHNIDEHLANEQYDEAIALATDNIKVDDELLPQYLFQRGYAYIQTNKIDLAIADLEQCISLTEEIPEAYYNLALLYYDTDQMSLAEETITKAIELDPHNTMFKIGRATCRYRRDMS